MGKRHQSERHEERVSFHHGQTYQKALEMLMKKVMAYDRKEVDDYIVTVLFEKAEGWNDIQNDSLVWNPPNADDNLHVEVVVQDKEFMFFIPYLDIKCRLIDTGKTEVGVKQQRFIWHPFVLHYGENWHIPQQGEYTAEITITMPEFRRHKKKLGNRYTKDISVTLGSFTLRPGAKDEREDDEN